MIEFKIFDGEYSPEWVNLQTHLNEIYPRFKYFGVPYRYVKIDEFLKQYNASITFKNPHDWRESSEWHRYITFENESDYMFFKLRFS